MVCLELDRCGCDQGKIINDLTDKYFCCIMRRLTVFFFSLSFYRRLNFCKHRKKFFLKRIMNTDAQAIIALAYVKARLFLQWGSFMWMTFLNLYTNGFLFFIKMHLFRKNLSKTLTSDITWLTIDDLNYKFCIFRKIYPTMRASDCRKIWKHTMNISWFFNYSSIEP